MEKISIQELDLLVKAGMNPIIKDWGIDTKLYNKTTWALASALSKKFEEYHKKGLLSKNENVMTSEERAEAVAALLDDRLRKKELTAAELRELKDLFNLKQKDQDIYIEMVDYREVYMDNAEIIEAVGISIDKANNK